MGIQNVYPSFYFSGGRMAFLLLGICSGGALIGLTVWAILYILEDDENDSRTHRRWARHR